MIRVTLIGNRAATAAILIVATAVLILSYWSTLRWLANSWLSSDYYSHGFLVPLVSAVIIWTKRKSLVQREPSILGIPILTLGALLYVLTLIFEIRVLGVLSLLSVIVGLVFIIFGIRAARTLIFPLAFLVFMIPFSFVPGIAYHLQEISVSASTWLLRTLGIPITSSGPQIQLGDVAFTVGLICSGVNTLIALLALAAIYVYILKGSMFIRVGLFIFAIPLAIAGNILRITSIIMVAYYQDAQTAIGWYHTVSSPVFFVLTFLALFLTGWVIQRKHIAVDKRLLVGVYPILFFAAEYLTFYVNDLVGVIFYALILATLLIQSVVVRQGGWRTLWVALGLVPLIRIVSLAMPVTAISDLTWYILIAIPITVGIVGVMRALKFSFEDIGFHGGYPVLQFLTALEGIGLGFIAYLILKPEALNSEPTILATLFPALVLLLCTGLVEEMAFRGVMQRAAGVLGSGGWIYIAVIYAVMQTGHGNLLFAIFAFATALLFGLIVKRTGSIIGVGLAHGLLNIGLFLVFPHFL